MRLSCKAEDGDREGVVVAAVQPDIALGPFLTQ
jgi:hypothetical protein